MSVLSFITAGRSVKKCRKNLGNFAKSNSVKKKIKKHFYQLRTAYLFKIIFRKRETRAGFLERCFKLLIRR